ncbi:hypothetical protein MPTK1_2g24540 [Marchantia polymorpha subsp. ruderalis]|uniref:Uncharacterized protein n=1 Tax=Marchantia polymorpha TaxID=3197 RepID=A0A2R6VX83_MARPO|nr:hypothetical protein MARPO_4376s0001 [Marchantia polymorpha]BBN03568.1 hypothetical protein Mp_2g24540 [Marchantia polymorpha subsp. ruderalis]|eukprot:PTQ26222.1 hypothetical protein MARPO_4376s0001 [Marchantia polymorpha]
MSKAGAQLPLDRCLSYEVCELGAGCLEVLFACNSRNRNRFAETMKRVPHALMCRPRRRHISGSPNQNYHTLMFHCLLSGLGL